MRPLSPRVEERARFVVGADGAHSVVAARAGALDYDSRPPMTCGYYTYWAGLPLEGIDVHFSYAPDDRWVSISFPTNDALDAALSGRQTFDAALAPYGRQRDAHARPHYETSIQAASFTQPPPQVYALRAALRHDPAAANQFYGVTVGALPRELFYAPTNIRRLLRTARAPPRPASPGASTRSPTRPPAVPGTPASDCAPHARPDPSIAPFPDRAAAAPVTPTSNGRPHNRQSLHPASPHRGLPSPISAAPQEVPQ